MSNKKYSSVEVVWAIDEYCNFSFTRGFGHHRRAVYMEYLIRIIKISERSRMVLIEKDLRKTASWSKVAHE